MPKVTMFLSNPFRPDPRPLKEAIYLTKLGYEVEILALDYRNLLRSTPTEEIDGIHIHRVFTSPETVNDEPESWEQITKIFYAIPFFWHFESLRHQLKFIKWIRSYLKENPTNYLHGHDLSGAWIGLKVRKACGCKLPVFFDMHEDYETPTRLKSRFRHLIRLFVHHVQNKCDANICVHLFQLRTMSEANIRKTIYLPNWPPRVAVRRAEHQPGEVLRLVYAGHIYLETVPLHEKLFEATKDLPVKITIHGHSVGYKALQEVAKGYPHVELTGKYDFRSDLDRIYGQADLVYILYDYASFGNRWNVGTKLYETLCAGVPFLIEHNTDMGDFATSAGVGLAVDTYEIEDIRRVIQSVLDDRTLLHRMRAKIMKYDFNEIFVWEKVVDNLRCLYRDFNDPNVAVEPYIPLWDVDVESSSVIPIFKGDKEN